MGTAVARELRFGSHAGNAGKIKNQSTKQAVLDFSSDGWETRSSTAPGPREFRSLRRWAGGKRTSSPSRVRDFHWSAAKWCDRRRRRRVDHVVTCTRGFTGRRFHSTGPTPRSRGHRYNRAVGPVEQTRPFLHDGHVYRAPVTVPDADCDVICARRHLSTIHQARNRYPVASTHYPSAKTCLRRVVCKAPSSNVYVTRPVQKLVSARSLSLWTINIFKYI